MQCAVPGKNLRVFAAAVQCLGKIGKELVMEAGKEGGVSRLVLTTMNDAKTSFTRFTFFEPFFERFVLEGSAQGSVLAAKIPLRACVSALKSNRTTERLSISFLDTGARHVVVFSSQCRGGLVKTHEMHYEETGILHATFDRDRVKNRVLAQTVMLQRAVQHIFGADEASLAVSPSAGLRLRSHFQYADRSSEYDTLKTDIVVGMDDLDALEAPKPCEIAFGLREVRALLQFCEHNDVLQVNVLFNEPGQPFLLASADEQPQDQHAAPCVFRAELIMATLDVEEVGDAEEDESRPAAPAVDKPRPSESSPGTKRPRSQHQQHDSTVAAKRASPERAAPEREPPIVAVAQQLAAQQLAEQQLAHQQQQQQELLAAGARTPSVKMDSSSGEDDDEEEEDDEEEDEAAASESSCSGVMQQPRTRARG